MNIDHFENYLSTVLCLKDNQNYILPKWKYMGGLFYLVLIEAGEIFPKFYDNIFEEDSSNFQSQHDDLFILGHK